MNNKNRMQSPVAGWLIAAFVIVFAGRVVADDGAWPTLSYNGIAQVQLASPADICLEEDEDEHCFVFQALDGSEFPGLQFPIEQLSIPEPAYGGLVAGRHGGDFGWFIYDLEQQDYVLSPAQKQEVLQAWQQRGLSPPEFVDALDAKPLFSRQRDSTAVFINAVVVVVGLVAAIALVLFVLLAVVRWVFRKRLKPSRLDQITHGLWILAVVCALAWLLALLLVLLSDT